MQCASHPPPHAKRSGFHSSVSIEEWSDSASFSARLRRAKPKHSTPSKFMAKAPSKRKSNATPLSEHARASEAVITFIAQSSHLQKPAIIAVREEILSANSGIHEGIKWNAPSFWRGEWFASFQLRAKGDLTLVLHRGAKVKAAEGRRFVEDPHGILTWITDDRCTVVFSDADDVKRKASSFRRIIRDWSAKVAAEVRNA